MSRLDKKSVERIRGAIYGIAKIPPEGDIKPLQGSKDGRMRLRVGSWRVIYKYEGKEQIEVLLVIDIGNRGDIYK